MRNLYDTIENPLVRVLACMEHAGIAVDVTELQPLAERLSSQVRAAHRGCCTRSSGAPFNINSPIQLREILFTERGLTPVEEDEDRCQHRCRRRLEKLRDQWPEFIGPLLAHREVEKLRSTYGEGLLAEVGLDGRDPRHVQPDRRPHRPAARATSRTSTTSPCAARKAASSGQAFVRAPGTELMVADYNQIELRVDRPPSPPIPGWSRRSRPGRTSITRPRRGCSRSS